MQYSSGWALKQHARLGAFQENTDWTRWGGAGRVPATPLSTKENCSHLWELPLSHDPVSRLMVVSRCRARSTRYIVSCKTWLRDRGWRWGPVWPAAICYARRSPLRCLAERKCIISGGQPVGRPGGEQLRLSKGRTKAGQRRGAEWRGVASRRGRDYHVQSSPQQASRRCARHVKSLERGV